MTGQPPFPFDEQPREQNQHSHSQDAHLNHQFHHQSQQHHDSTLGPGNEERTLASLPHWNAIQRQPTQPLPARHWRPHRHFARTQRRKWQARQARSNRIAWRCAWVLAVIGVLIASLGASSVVAAAAFYKSAQPAVQGLRQDVASKDSVRIYDANGKLLYQFNQNGAQHSISLAQIPVNVVNATVAIEDHTFWTNDGIDATSVVRAALADATHQHVLQGASTITQQLIKMQVLGSEVTLSRKLEEAILSVGVTETGAYSKQQILQMYLNSIPYSPTAYGIDAAASYYFGYTDNPHTGETAAQHLDLAQASLLAGIPQNPNLNDPLLHPQQAHKRQIEVLNAMVKYGYITRAQATQAEHEASQPGFLKPGASAPDLAPAFVHYVQQQVEQMIGNGQIRSLGRSGLNIYTTLDMNLQNHTQQAMKEHLYGNDLTDFAQPTYIRNDNATNSAALIADQHTGAIKVYLGSVDYHDSSIGGQFDVISQGYRSPGSSFKPIVYATAFEKGWFPALSVPDVPTEFYTPGSSQVWKPLDYGVTEAAGQVTLRTALDWSLNIPAARVMQYAGIQNVKATAERLGITSWRGTWGLSSVLGTLDVTPLEMVQAYTVFANYGQYIPLHTIDRITDNMGNVLYQYQTPQPVQVLDPRIAFQITSMLSDNASRAGDFGGCSPLYLAPYFGAHNTHYTFSGAYASSECAYMKAHRYLTPDAWPTAAKTGTAQDFTDDWTMGYTMDYTAAVWTGNNNDSPMHNVDGVSASAPIWYSAMLYAEESTGKARRPFPVPQGVHQANYCSEGVCTTDWFLDGTQPSPNLGEYSPMPCVALNAGDTGWNYSSGKCDISLQRHELQNAGAPPTTQYVGAP